MIVCWLTLQILAASPVVNTVFIRASTLPAPAGRMKEARTRPHGRDRTGTHPWNPYHVPGTTRDDEHRRPRRRREGDGGQLVRAWGLKKRSKMVKLGTQTTAGIITRNHSLSTRSTANFAA